MKVCPRFILAVLLGLFCISSIGYGESYSEGEYAEEYDEDEDWGEDEEEYGEEDEGFDEGLAGDSDSILYLLDENREVELKPEDFIYIFDPQQKPMLQSNLIPTVQEVAGSFSSRRKKAGKNKKRGGRLLASKNLGFKSGFKAGFAGKSTSIVPGQGKKAAAV